MTSFSTGLKVLFILIPVLLVLSLASYFIVKKIKKFLKKIPDNVDVDGFDEILYISGYMYDTKQDIFYSHPKAWQKDFGYCSLYDEAAAPFSMIIDCEPIYFDYNGKKWLIEFWKGQYGMTTGCEVGIYSTSGPDINIPGVFEGAFYHCAKERDLFEISISLIKNKKVLFTRQDNYWWLTGFILGEFSDPSDLIVDIKITLKSRGMLKAFIKGLKDTGYSKYEMLVIENTVSLIFSDPFTKQPDSRTKKAEYITQLKNKYFCDEYIEITNPYDNISDKLKAVKKQSPELYRKVLDIGKSKNLFNVFKTLNLDSDRKKRNY
jgi:hypothetical protein